MTAEVTSGKRVVTVLSINQLLAGLGMAAGIAVGGVFAEKLSGSTAMAGFAQTASVLGAALTAIPLAKLAQSRGRSFALRVGYMLALLGTGMILLSPMTGSFVFLLLGFALFGTATAAGLQARFAAAESVGPAYAARAMSIVLWATTIGSVMGPNLSQAGADLGEAIGIEPLVGPYIFAVISFVLAALLLMLFVRKMGANDAGADRTKSSAPIKRTGVMTALRGAAKNKGALFGLLAVISSHTVMVSVMVMTPVHMTHYGAGLDMIGLVISIHIIGMYGASPLFGWLTDKVGEVVVIFIGIGIFAIAIICGFLAAGENMVLMSTALGLLGLGWSAGMIGGSSLLTKSTPADERIPLQGASDMLMNLFAAASSAFSGIILGIGGFRMLNLTAGAVLVPLLLFGLYWMLTRKKSPAPNAAAAAPETSAPDENAHSSSNAE